MKKKYEKIAVEINDAQIMSWILGSIDSQFILHLPPYKTAKEMLGYLKQIYNQENYARRFQLEHEILQYTQGEYVHSELLRICEFCRLNILKLLTLMFQLNLYPLFKIFIRQTAEINF